MTPQITPSLTSTPGTTQEAYAEAYSRFVLKPEVGQTAAPDEICEMRSVLATEVSKSDLR